MQEKFIRIISPFTLLVVAVLDAAVIYYGIYAAKCIIKDMTVWTILFAVIEVLAFAIMIPVTSEVFKNGVSFKIDKMEFVGIDDENIFHYADIKSVEISKDTKASFKKNFVDRYSRIILYMNDESIVTVDLGYTTSKTLRKVENEIKARI